VIPATSWPRRKRVNDAADHLALNCAHLRKCVACDRDFIILHVRAKKIFLRRHASCFGVAVGPQEFWPDIRPSANHDGLKMNGRADDRLPKFVPWACLVAVALAMVIFFASSPTSHTRRALCMSFASIYADQCPVSP
jgi:hypothetical protein